MLPRNPSLTSYKLLLPAFPRLQFSALPICSKAKKPTAMHPGQFGGLNSIIFLAMSFKYHLKCGMIDGEQKA
jgi:hypothetical protein